MDNYYNVHALHTKSYWGAEADLIDLDFVTRDTDEYKTALKYLQDQEQKLYASLGCHTFEQFRDKLKEAFSPKNMEVLRRFQPNQLEKSLQQFTGQYSTLYEQDVRLTFELNKVVKLDYKMKDNAFVDDNGSPLKQLSIYVDNFSATTIKEKLNAYFADRHFITSSEYMEAVNALLDNLLNEGALKISIKDPKTGDFTTKWNPPPIPNFPWGCTLKQLEEAKKHKVTKVIKAYKQAAQQIKDFVCVTLSDGADKELQDAIKTTWDENFTNANRDPAIFFQGTTKENFISAVQGSLGEFQAAVIFTFLDQKFGTKNNYAKILADQLKNGEQLKTDIEIIEGLGLQVKNYTEIKDSQTESTRTLRDISTNIHPDRLAEVMGTARKYQFLDYISNYFFNKTFAEKTKDVYSDMVKMLGGYLGEIMNMTMGDVMKDTISFYFISGKYLVPASRILEAANRLGLTDNIIITSSYKGLTDEEYMVQSHTNRRGRFSPLYVDYWRHYRGGWRQTPKNTTEYTNLISHSISIRTKFNLFDEIENYAII